MQLTMDSKAGDGAKRKPVVLSVNHKCELIKVEAVITVVWVCGVQRQGLISIVLCKDKLRP